MSDCNDRRIWVDGTLVPWADATVHVLSHSLQRGSLVFDYMSVHQTPRGPAIFRLAEHVERLIRTCELAGLPLAYSKTALVDACAETVRHNPGARSVKISALIASIEVELIPQDPTVSVFVAAYDSAADIAAPLPAGIEQQVALAKPKLKALFDFERKHPTKVDLALLRIDNPPPGKPFRLRLAPPFSPNETAP